MGDYQTSFSFGAIQDLQRWRHIVQFLTFIFLNGKFWGLASTVLIVPYLHSTQSPFSTVSGAYESLEYTIAKGLFPLLVLGVIYLTASTVGRVYCGWACPFGMVQDFLSYLPFKKEKISTTTSASLKDVKWAVVAFSVLISVLAAYRRETIEKAGMDIAHPVGVFSDSPFSVFSPASTLFVYIPYMITWKNTVLSTVGMIGWLKMGLLILALAPSIYIPRFFCRFLCPMGALLEPLSKYKMLRIHRSSKQTKEELNKILADVCPMGVQVTNEADFIDHPGCIHCGRCVTEAPKHLSP